MAGRKKALWVLFLGLLLSLVLGAVIYGTAGEKPVSYLQGVLVATKVDKLPRIDGVMDPQEPWGKASELNLNGPGEFKLRAVYTHQELALLATWKGTRMSMTGPDAWIWKGDRWIKVRETVPEPEKWGSYKLQQRYPEWFAFYWGKDIAPADWMREGCLVTCKRKKAQGFAHGVISANNYCDTWIILARHGYGPWFNIEGGWIAGDISAKQTGTLKFDEGNAIDPCCVVGGELQFLGHAEDKFLTAEGDPLYPKMDTEDAQYCLKCHTPKEVKQKTMVGDAGGMKYYGNRNVDAINPSAPKYMQKNPKDFVDAMIITQEEIDKGEAVEVAKLSKEEISRYWANYQRLHAVVPQLILKTPTDSQADVRMGAVWKDGVWTVEIRRALVTGHDDDVAFADLSKDYHFGISLWERQDLGKSWRTADLVLRFER